MSFISCIVLIVTTKTVRETHYCQSSYCVLEGEEEEVGTAVGVVADVLAAGLVRVLLKIE
jgi:hypothetical protein